MKRSVSLLLVLLTFLANQKLPACTAFQLQSLDKSWVYFRSMEFGFPFHSQAIIVPRGTEFAGTTPDGKSGGMKWSAQYGFVGMNVNIAPNIVADGMNEKGLVVGMLYLPGYSEYLPANEAKNPETIGSWEVANYLLSKCATVAEAKAALEKDVYVTQEIFPPFKRLLPVHFYIADASGAVVIAEYVGGKLRLHDNPIGILTNSPPFDWQTINLGNFVNLSPVNVPQVNLKNFSVQNYGQGSGLIGLPGDFTPPSRFVRATVFSESATPQPTALETVNEGFHVLNTFDIFAGAIRSNTANQTANTKGFLSSSGPAKIVNTDTTEWVVGHDRTNLRTYIRTYEGLQIEMIDLKKIDFTKPGILQVKVERDFAPTDLSGTGTPLSLK
jgi:choloylglycine hydrolase